MAPCGPPPLDPPLAGADPWRHRYANTHNLKVTLLGMSSQCSSVRIRSATLLVRVRSELPTTDLPNVETYKVAEHPFRSKLPTAAVNV